MKAGSGACTRPNRGNRIEIACSEERNSLIWRTEFPGIAAGNFAHQAVEWHANPRRILRLLVWKHCRQAAICARKTSISGNIRERAKTFALRRAPRSPWVNPRAEPRLRSLLNQPVPMGEWQGSAAAWCQTNHIRPRMIAFVHERRCSRLLAPDLPQYAQEGIAGRCPVAGARTHEAVLGILRIGAGAIREVAAA